MKPVFIATASSLIGVLVGSVGTNRLRAESSPVAYSIGEIQIRNADGFRHEYLPLGQAAIKKYGGRAVAAGSSVPLAGDAPQGRVATYAWQSMAQLKAWFASPEYTKAREVGVKYATFRNYALPGAK